MKSGSLKRYRRGTVLIIVLSISMGLVALAVYFGNSMILEYKAADNVLASLQSAQAIEGAQRYIEWVLKNREDDTGLPDIDEYETEQVNLGEAWFWLVGREDGTSGQNESDYGLQDEAAKLNLNTATLDMLLALPDMTEEFASAIIDWRDEDSEPQPSGAEAQTYLLKDPAYNCKDANFETIYELFLVEGAEWDILFGEDTNRNGMLDPYEDDGDKTDPDDNRDGTLDMGVLEYVTVYSQESNKQEDGSSKININSDQDSELQSLLSEKLGSERASQIMQAIGGGMGQNDFSSLLDFYYRSQMTLEEFAQVANALTISDESTVEGLINVNTASEVVLACIPGIGQQYASQLVDYRTGQEDSLDSVAWVTQVLEQENAIQAGPYITARSYQFRADIVALGHDGKGLNRTEIVFDTSGDEPEIIYRRDLGSLGWPLGSEMRENLAEKLKEEERFQ